MARTSRIHINQHIIKHNKKDVRKLPPITVKDYRENRRGFSVKIHGPASVVYSPDAPLHCGATCWIETKAPVEVK